MLELIGLLIFISAFFCNALYLAYNDLILAKQFARAEKLSWIKEREHVFKTYSLIAIGYAVYIGSPTWYNVIGWLLLGYGFTWCATYYHFKLGFFLSQDGQHLPSFGFKDKRWEPSPLVWTLLMLVGFPVGGATLSLI